MKDQLTQGETQSVFFGVFNIDTFGSSCSDKTKQFRRKTTYLSANWGNKAVVTRDSPLEQQPNVEFFLRRTGITRNGKLLHVLKRWADFPKWANFVFSGAMVIIRVHMNRAPCICGA